MRGTVRARCHSGTTMRTTGICPVVGMDPSRLVRGIGDGGRYHVANVAGKVLPPCCDRAPVHATRQRDPAAGAGGFPPHPVWAPTPAEVGRTDHVYVCIRFDSVLRVAVRAAGDWHGGSPLI